MPVWALTILSSVGSVLLSMATSLITEAFLKKAVIIALSQLVDRTATDVDNQLLAAAKEAWKA